jgi:uncharacterized protein (DUF934 family)
MQQTLNLLSAQEHEAQADARVLQLTNDADPLTVPLEGIDRVELSFPKFTDGRAYSQAWLIRRRRRFTGDIRAKGEVLIDQLVQMQRCGFSSAVLSAGKDAADAKLQFARYLAYYQGDASEPRPLFARSDR